MTERHDHPLEVLEDVADRVARGRRWVVRGREVVLCVDLDQGGHLELTHRGPDRFDVLVVGQDASDVERLLVALTARADRVEHSTSTSNAGGSS